MDRDDADIVGEEESADEKDMDGDFDEDEEEEEDFGDSEEGEEY